jgi:DNA-binding response OmpR family regulator
LIDSDIESDTIKSEVNMNQKIMLVEDEAKISRTIALYLEQAGFLTIPVYDGAQVMPVFSREHPDLIILDIMLPHVDGWELCRQLRHSTDVPIIMLTALGEETDRILGLELGADDYITKPFSPREVVARVRALFRRARGQMASSSTINIQTVNINLDRHTVTNGDQLLDLTPIEFDLLVTLARHPGQVFTRLQLLEAAQGTTYEGYERAIDQHIKNLRSKLGDDARRPRYIQTIFGVGYKFLEG